MKLNTFYSSFQQCSISKLTKQKSDPDRFQIFNEERSGMEVVDVEPKKVHSSSQLFFRNISIVRGDVRCQVHITLSVRVYKRIRVSFL